MLLKLFIVYFFQNAVINYYLRSKPNFSIIIIQKTKNSTPTTTLMKLIWKCNEIKKKSRNRTNIVTILSSYSDYFELCLRLKFKSLGEKEKGKLLLKWLMQAMLHHTNAKDDYICLCCILSLLFIPILLSKGLVYYLIKFVRCVFILK